MFVYKIFVLKNVVVYKNFYCVQLHVHVHTMYILRVLKIFVCLIFVVFDAYENSSMTKISQIMVSPAIQC